MSGRSRHLEMGRYQMGALDEPEPPSKCSRFLYYTWKFCTCVFSHTMLISMVVSYCIFGAFTFESLEAENERNVKRSILHLRNNVTEAIWVLTDELPAYHPENWTILVIKRLREFETDLLKAMKKDGWDGNEDIDAIQWTFTGALFYSIIVITTIGYGHIAPKTHWGKVVTIFYAILGIPLMLLCLSNIGDIMATSFRFLYWRVCCYVCTKKPKRHRRSGRSSRATIRQSGGRYSGRSRNASFRRSERTSQRSADSGFGPSELTPSSYSDTEFRYNGDGEGSIQRHMRQSHMSRYSDTTVPAVPPLPGASRISATRGGSLDRRKRNEIVDHVAAARTPVLCNKYAVDKDVARKTLQPLDVDRNAELTDNSDVEEGGRPRGSQRSQSVPRQQQYLKPPSPPAPGSLDDSLRKKDRRRGTAGSHHSPSPRIMSPMGFAIHRQHYDDFYDTDEYFDDMYYSSSNGERRIKPVPIWLCVFLVVSYILGGAFLFTRWEHWVFLDSAYFCFITLTTIGFGDFVPAKRVKQNAEVSIALCSLYLLFGIALLAMSFNLVQEEVIANVKSVAKRLGIIKDDEEDEDND